MATTTQMRFIDIEQAVRHLGEHDFCDFCKNKGVITCPDHLAPGNYEIAGPDGYKFCFSCDTAYEEAPKIGCPCGDVC